MSLDMEKCLVETFEKAISSFAIVKSCPLSAQFIASSLLSKLEEPKSIILEKFDEDDYHEAVLTFICHHVKNVIHPKLLQDAEEFLKLSIEERTKTYGKWMWFLVRNSPVPPQYVSKITGMMIDIPTLSDYIILDLLSCETEFQERIQEALSILIELDY